MSSIYQISKDTNPERNVSHGFTPLSDGISLHDGDVIEYNGQNYTIITAYPSYVIAYKTSNPRELFKIMMAIDFSSNSLNFPNSEIKIISRKNTAEVVSTLLRNEDPVNSNMAAAAAAGGAGAAANARDEDGEVYVFSGLHGVDVQVRSDRHVKIKLRKSSGINMKIQIGNLIILHDAKKYIIKDIAILPIEITNIAPFMIMTVLTIPSQISKMLVFSKNDLTTNAQIHKYLNKISIPIEYFNIDDIELSINKNGGVRRSKHSVKRRKHKSKHVKKYTKRV